MTNASSNQSQVRYAKLAGFMFLFVDLAYALGMFITSRFIVNGTFVETAHRILASELLFRIGLSLGLLGGLSTVFLAMGLYGVTKPVDNNLALLAFAFRLVEATLFGVMAVSSFVNLNLYLGTESMHAFSATQLTVFVNLHSGEASAGFNIAAIFFSMGSILFFYLFTKSKYIPRFLAQLGFYGSFLVPVTCFGSLLFPQYSKMLFAGWAPIGLAEISVGIWLLIKGIKVPQQA
jgi:hypothetical protein